MTTRTPTDLPDALRLALEALEHSEPTHKHYAEPLERHAQAIAAARSALSAAAPTLAPFQQRVQPWMMECFGPMIAGDRQERNHRFLEEALELVQAAGCSASEAHQLVDYVYGRPVGEPSQEVGGVMVTLAALCLANGLDMHTAADTELARIWTKVEAIRAKQAAKPKHSPLPESAAPQPPAALPGEQDAALPQHAGIYAWVSGHSAALVLVDKRPTMHEPGGQLNGSVMQSTKFYSGCAVKDWGRDGRWILLHDFDAARASMAAKGRTDGGEPA